MHKFENRIEEEIKIEEQMQSIYAKTMKSVPKIKFNFTLGELRVTLQHDAKSAIQLYSK